MINLTTILPPIELSKYVRKIFIIESTGKAKHFQKSVANPYVHLSFIPKKPPIPKVGNTIIPIIDKLYFVGPIVNANVMLEYSGEVTQLAIEFTSTGFYSLFHMSPANFVDFILPLESTISKKEYKRLYNSLSITNQINKQKKIIELFLFEKSKRSIKVISYVEEALEVIKKNNGYIPLKNIVEKIQISERQFRRKFKEIIGVSPKTYCEILNSHFIITCMQKKDYKSIQDLAYRSNFYDMAHFCNRFKKIMGFKPTEFIDSELVNISKNLYNQKYI